MNQNIFAQFRLEKIFLPKFMTKLSNFAAFDFHFFGILQNKQSQL